MKDAATNQIYTANGGNVGIGTTAPGKKLDVYSTSSNGVARFTGNTGVQMNFYDAGNGLANSRNWVIGNNLWEYGDFAFMQSNAKDGDPYSAGTVKFQISNTGNVGIGTAPAEAVCRRQHPLRAESGLSGTFTATGAAQYSVELPPASRSTPAA